MCVEQRSLAEEKKVLKEKGVFRQTDKGYIVRWVDGWVGGWLHGWITEGNIHAQRNIHR